MYKPFFTEYFNEKIKKWLKKDRNAVIKVKKKIEDDLFLSDPQRKAILIKDPDLLGMRRTKFSNIRLSFNICKECKETGEKEIYNCNFCDQLPENAIVIFDFDYRKSFYK